MNRVLPMIFTCLGIVGYAVFQAHADTDDDLAYYVPASQPVVIDQLD
ncbi:MAG: hypothetical protein JXQ85_15120 [Cognatishimia sp.]